MTPSIGRTQCARKPDCTDTALMPCQLLAGSEKTPAGITVVIQACLLADACLCTVMAMSMDTVTIAAAFEIRSVWFQGKLGDATRAQIGSCDIAATTKLCIVHTILRMHTDTHAMHPHQARQHAARRPPGCQTLSVYHEAGSQHDPGPF